jgi:hypothetical protein
MQFETEFAFGSKSDSPLTPVPNLAFQKVINLKVRVIHKTGTGKESPFYKYISQDTVFLSAGGGETSVGEGNSI